MSRYKIFISVILTLQAVVHISTHAQIISDSLSEKLISTDLWNDGSILRYAPEDQHLVLDMTPRLDKARKKVAGFFNSEFPEPVLITLAPNRASFTEILNNEWGIPQTACWMVATGVADFMVILSPRVWKEEACEHDPENDQHIQEIVIHELVHVFHGQHNETRDFTGAEEVGWFAEGIAVVVADQLSKERILGVIEAIKKNEIPEKLINAWSGENRYGISGSIVLYIQEKKDRSILKELLAVTSQSEFLKVIEMNEQDLLKAWEEWMINKFGN
ncbi:MAG: hypothetical protein ABJK11_04765 [Balneola sp.]